MSILPLSSMKGEIRSLITQDRVKEAFQLLSQTALNPEDQHTLNMLKSRFHRWEKDTANGTHSTEELDLEINQIKSGLLRLISREGAKGILFTIVKFGGIGSVIVIVLIFAIMQWTQPTTPTTFNSTTGGGSPIINAGGNVDYRQETKPIQVPENLREYVTDTTLLDTTP